MPEWVSTQEGPPPGLQSEFQDSQGYTEKPCLQNKTKQNKTKKQELTDFPKLLLNLYFHQPPK